MEVSFFVSECCPEKTNCPQESSEVPPLSVPRQCERRGVYLVPTLMPESPKKHLMGCTRKTNSHWEDLDFGGSLASRGVLVRSEVAGSRVRVPNGSLENPRICSIFWEGRKIISSEILHCPHSAF
jgi:hypothetical protein